MQEKLIARQTGNKAWIPNATIGEFAEVSA
jgi:hypothetical protein